jgi:putative permease
MTVTSEPKKRKPTVKKLALADQAGPTDISDPMLRAEVKRAAVWIGMAALVALVVVLADPLLVIFGGMVFAAMIDGGARLLGRVLPIPRGWRVAIIILMGVGFITRHHQNANPALAGMAARAWLCH